MQVPEQDFNEGTLCCTLIFVYLTEKILKTDPNASIIEHSAAKMGIVRTTLEF